jgi:hypothetical protein
MCCGSDNQTVQQQSVTMTPEGKQYADYALQTIGRGVTESNNPYTAYPHSRVAGFTPDTLAQFDATRANQGAYMPGLTAAYDYTQTAGQTLPQFDINQYMNPFTQNVTDIAKREAVRQDDISRQSRDASAVGAGSFGGTRHALIEAEAGRNLGQRLSDIQMTGDMAAYQSALAQINADRSAALGAGAQSARLGQLQSGLGYTDAAALGDIGGIQQQQEQRQLDTAYQDFLTQRDWNKGQLSFLNSLIRGTPSNAFGSNTTSTTTAPPTSSLAQLGGLGLTATSLIGGTGGFGSSGWLTKLLFAKGGPVRASTPQPGRVERAQRRIRNFHDPLRNDRAIEEEIARQRQARQNSRVVEMRKGGLASLPVKHYADGGFVSGLPIDEALKNMSPGRLQRFEMSLRQAGNHDKADYVKNFREKVGSQIVPQPAPPSGLRAIAERILSPAQQADPWIPERDLEGIRGRYPNPPEQTPAPYTGEPMGDPENITGPHWNPEMNRTPVRSTGGLPQEASGLEATPEAEQMTAEPSMPLFEPTAEQTPGPQDKLGETAVTSTKDGKIDPWAMAAVAGLRMLAAKPGENFGQALGAGGLEAIKVMQQNRAIGADEKRAAATERDVARREKEDAAQEKYLTRKSELDRLLAENKINAQAHENDLNRAKAEYFRAVKSEEARARLERNEAAAAIAREKLQDKVNADAGKFYEGLTKKIDDPEAGYLMEPREREAARLRAEQDVIRTYPKSNLARELKVKHYGMARTKIMTAKAWNGQPMTEELRKQLIEQLEQEYKAVLKE